MHVLVICRIQPYYVRFYDVSNYFIQYYNVWRKSSIDQVSYRLVGPYKMVVLIYIASSAFFHIIIMYWVEKKELNMIYIYIYIYL